MKNINAKIGIGALLCAGALALSLTLVAGSVAAANCQEHHGKVIHPAFRTNAVHARGNDSGLRCDIWWWIRR